MTAAFGCFGPISQRSMEAYACLVRSRIKVLVYMRALSSKWITFCENFFSFHELIAIVSVLIIHCETYELTESRSRPGNF